MTAPLIGEVLSSPLQHPNKTYHEVLTALAIVPEHIYARCDALARFDFGTTRAERRVMYAPPQVGQKPTVKRKRKKAR